DVVDIVGDKVPLRPRLDPGCEQGALCGHPVTGRAGSHGGNVRLESATAPPGHGAYRQFGEIAVGRGERHQATSGEAGRPESVGGVLGAVVEYETPFPGA